MAIQAKQAIAGRNIRLIMRPASQNPKPNLKPSLDKADGFFVSFFNVVILLIP